MIECLDEDYRSEQPLHPSAGFSGRDQVAENWSLMFAEVPDLRIEVLRAAFSGIEAWTELRVHGSKLDGTAFDYRGVAIWGVVADRIVWARFYFEVVEDDSPPIDERMHRVLGDR